MTDGGDLLVVSGLRLGAVVLAAGAGRRFGGDKLSASLDGRPILQHVLDTLAAVRPAVTVVVLAPGMHDLERVAWRTERRLVNPDPGRGISSSVRLGIKACADEPGLDGAFILLADQPRTAVVTIRALAAEARAALAAGAWAVIPGYAGGGGANPVLLLRAGFTLMAGISGDHGLSATLAERPERVRRVPVAGSNPDIDTPQDLRALQA